MTHFCLKHEITARKCDITVLTENGLSSGAAVPVPGAPKGFSSKPDIWTAISCQEFGIYLPYTHTTVPQWHQIANFWFQVSYSLKHSILGQTNTLPVKSLHFGLIFLQAGL